MRYRSLALYPLVYAVVFVAICRAIGAEDALKSFVFWQKILVRMLALTGCWLAVSVFERGDHLKRAWTWMVLTTVAVLTRDLLIGFFPAARQEPATVAVSTALVLLSNVALVAGIWQLARTWKVAAIELPGGRSGQIAVALVAAALALAVAGPDALASIRALPAGDPGAITSFVSSAADVVSLLLISPLLLTALALRGGSFVWPWAFVTASLFSWLLYDGTGMLAARLGVADGFPLHEVFRGMAENYLAAAGLAQYFVVRRVLGAR